MKRQSYEAVPTGGVSVATWSEGKCGTGETLGARRRNLAEEALRITVSGKSQGRCQGVGSGHTTWDPRAKRAGREGPGPVGNPNGKARQW